MIRKDAFKVVDGYKLIVNKEIFEENVDFCFRESRGVKQPVFYECGKSKLFSLLRNS